MKIAIGMPAYTAIPQAAAVSHTALHAALDARGHSVMWQVVTGIGLIDTARNATIAHVLASGHADELDGMLWLDSDQVVHQPGQVVDMIEAAHEHRLDFVAAAARLKVDQSMPRFGVHPHRPLERHPHVDLPHLVRVHAIGAGCMWWSRRLLGALLRDRRCYQLGEWPWVAPLVWRCTVEELDEPVPIMLGGDPDHVMECQVRYVGEDMALCRALERAGVQLWCDTEVDLGHVGPKNWRGTLADAFELEDAVAAQAGA